MGLHVRKLEILLLRLKKNQYAIISVVIILINTFQQTQKNSCNEAFNSTVKKSVKQKSTSLYITTITKLILCHKNKSFIENLYIFIIAEHVPFSTNFSFFISI